MRMTCVGITVLLLMLTGIHRLGEAGAPDERLAEKRALATIELVQDRSISASDKQAAVRTAVAEMIQFATDHPHNALVRYATGLSLLSSEDVQGATTHLGAAYELSQHDAQVGFMYGLALKMNRRPLAAIEIYRQLARRHPQLHQLRITLALYLMSVQQYDEAYGILKQFRQPGRKKPGADYAILLSNMGECLLYLGEHEEAVAELEVADRYLPNAVTILTTLAEAYMKNGHPEKAKNVLRKALKVNANAQSALFLMGGILQEESPKEANEYFRRARLAAENGLKINSDNGSDHFLLYLICDKLGEVEKAAEYKKQAAELHFTFEAPWKRN